jgi:hypothetical protein
MKEEKIPPELKDLINELRNTSAGQHYLLVGYRKQRGLAIDYRKWSTEIVSLWETRVLV